MRGLLPGLAVTAVIALCAKLIAGYFHVLGSVSIAIILGAIIGNVINISGRCNKGVGFAEKKILTLAIVLMGFNLQLNELSAMGIKVFAVVIPLMIITIGSALFIGRIAGFSKSLGLLLGVGNAVCGSSAIAAVAPVAGSDEDEIGISISVVNLLGTVGMVLLPFVCRQLDFSDIQSSYLLGGTLQAVGQVVAAGFSLSDNIGETATVIKMLRVIMIGPVVIFFTLLNRNAAGRNHKKNYIPNYMIGFFLCSIIASIFNNDVYIIPWLQKAASLLLVIAMAGIGLKIDFRTLISQGGKALAAGIVIVFIQLITALTGIMLLM